MKAPAINTLDAPNFEGINHLKKDDGILAGAPAAYELNNRWIHECYALTKRREHVYLNLGDGNEVGDQ